MIQSNRQLIKALANYTAQFKPTKKQDSKLGDSYQQIRDSQILNQSVTTWLHLVKVYCPQLLKYYPQNKFGYQYKQQVVLIDTQLNFKGYNEPALKYTLIKSKTEVNKFTHQFHKENAKKNHQQEQNNQIYQILSNYSLKDKKSKHLFQQFIQQVAPHQKWNIRILGQYKVVKVQTQSVKGCINQTICRPCQQFKKFYLTIANQCIILSDQTLVNGVVQQAIPYTYALKIEYMNHQYETYGHKFVVKIISGKTQLQLAFQSLFDLAKFAYTFNLVKKTLPYYKSEILRFDSFSPIRQNNWTNFYSDGQSYFSDLHDQIQRAQKKICITGWCITPYFLLKRPQNIQNGQSRLDRLLLRAAKRGVKIFILIYQQPSLFLNNDSFNVWSLFQNMDENFKVLRHPGIIIPKLWSHHQKSVIIDQTVAFMGGLDICYGRWDNHEHLINKNGTLLWQGADYVNQRLRGITQPRKFWQSNLDPKNQPRMPWHDIALQFKGPAVIDLQRHFVQYWYFAIQDLSDDPRDHLRNFKTRYNQLKRQHADPNNPQKQDFQLFTKQKLTKEELENVELTYAMQKNNETTTQDYSFSDRVRHAKQAFKDLVQNKASTTSKQIIVEGFTVIDKPGSMRLQLCRSSSNWSTGIQRVEHSIYNAYLKLIEESKELIYIQNQFFMSYENLISETIAQRIRNAYKRKQKFKVIVVMPLLPGFEGDVTKQSSGVLRVQMQMQYEAISRHKSSIFQLIKDLPININDYIEFFGLRNHGLFGETNNVPKTQIIYVHSKLMIVDDRYMIIGSANINDRSLLGSRDSQLAMIIEDPQGSIGKGSIFNFRCKIFNEHFGINEINCKDMNSYWSKLIQIGQKNTQIYRQVFGCYPDNIAVRFSDVAKLQKQANPSLYWNKINNLFGHYVMWPTQFLKEENLNLKLGQKQYYAPITSFT